MLIPLYRHAWEDGDTNCHSYSASPLNGEAAELWDKDMVEFKKKVLGRHRDIEEE